jgi:predicted phage tail protein
MSNPSTSTDKTDSFAISGATNTGTQGSAIPLVYGEAIVGSIGVSFDADIEDIGAWKGVVDDPFAGFLPSGSY